MADFAFTRQDETLVAAETTKTVPLTCHGHTRPVTHVSFSSQLSSGAGSNSPQYYMISACKDNNPMLRDGVTGDWVGTFIGHKGAIWSARLSGDASLAATGSADFSARVWDTFTGVTLHSLHHEHIVRAVAFPPQERPTHLATGGMERKLRVFDLACVTNADNGSLEPIDTTPAYELGAEQHGGPIKSIIWSPDPNIIVTAADDKFIRWWDVRAQAGIASHELDTHPGACELSVGGSGMDGGNASSASSNVLSVAAGKHVYLFDAARPGQLQQHIRTGREVAGVAINAAARRMVTGSPSDTWVHVWDLDSEREVETGKGHHGPVWTTAFSPDGRIYATGSEDGTVKMWKAAEGPYGLWR